MLCQHYLNTLYNQKELPTLNKNQNKNISETYGEILYESLATLMDAIVISEQDIFIDLGSGLGKVAIQFFLNSGVKESYGIEIVPELHERSAIAAQKVKVDLPDFFIGERKLMFIANNFLNISLNNATIALIASPCFSQTILNSLGEILNNTPSIHTVLSLRPISTLKRLIFVNTIRVECSWDTALCYIYTKLRY